MRYMTLTIAPTTQLVTDEEIEALRLKQEYVAKKMGALWLLHKDNAVQKKSTEVK